MQKENYTRNKKQGIKQNMSVIHNQNGKRKMYQSNGMDIMYIRHSVIFTRSGKDSLTFKIEIILRQENLKSSNLSKLCKK